MKLNGWQRIGVVVSILWAIGAAIFERKSQVDPVNEQFVIQLQQCSHPIANECFNLAAKQRSELIAWDFSGVSNILFASLGPIVVAWLTAYLAIKAFFWVKAGFQSNV
jgi:hypothetical protein